MKLTKQQLKQTIKEELGSLDRAILDQLKLIVSSLGATNKKLENIDTSLDFVGGALTGQDPLAIGMGHDLVGRWQPRPSAVRSAAEPEVNETSTKGKHKMKKMKLTKNQLADVIREELESVLGEMEQWGQEYDKTPGGLTRSSRVGPRPKEEDCAELALKEKDARKIMSDNIVDGYRSGPYRDAQREMIRIERRKKVLNCPKPERPKREPVKLTPEEEEKAYEMADMYDQLGRGG
tara:strand:+ start:2999 stop:3703 length:705 start_codon:yes stop_codon:yes gene_type:complete